MFEKPLSEYSEYSKNLAGELTENSECFDYSDKEKSKCLKNLFQNILIIQNKKNKG